MIQSSEYYESSLPQPEVEEIADKHEYSSTLPDSCSNTQLPIIAPKAVDIQPNHNITIAILNMVIQQG